MEVLVILGKNTDLCRIYDMIGHGISLNGPADNSEHFRSSCRPYQRDDTDAVAPVASTHGLGFLDTTKGNLK